MGAAERSSRPSTVHEHNQIIHQSGWHRLQTVDPASQPNLWLPIVTQGPHQAYGACYLGPDTKPPFAHSALKPVTPIHARTAQSAPTSRHNLGIPTHRTHQAFLLNRGSRPTPNQLSQPPNQPAQPKQPYQLPQPTTPTDPPRVLRLVPQQLQQGRVGREQRARSRGIRVVAGWA